MVVGSTQIGARLMLRVRPRLLMAPGFLVAAIGMGILAQIKVDSAYAESLGRDIPQLMAEARGIAERA